MNRRDFLQTAAVAVLPAIPEPATVPAHAAAPQRPRADLPEEAELVHMVHYTALACEALLRAHGAGCPCFRCEDTRGLLYNLEIGLAALGGDLLTTPGDVVDCPCCGQRWEDE